LGIHNLLQQTAGTRRYKKGLGLTQSVVLPLEMRFATQGCVVLKQ
jgi:hypothetical protein